MEYLTFENAIMVAIFVYTLCHRPWGSSDFVERKLKSTWMPKESKHPLIEMDKEIQETEQLERMWKL